MNRLKIGYYLLKYFGPRIAWLRAEVYARKWLGTSRRQFRSRPWESRQLADLTGPTVPRDWNAYADWKQEHLPPFMFGLGHPPAVTDLDTLPGPRRTPPLAQRLEQLRQGRCYYFLHSLSPERIDWYHNPISGGRSDPVPTWCDIPDYLPQQGDPRLLWEPARCGWSFDTARAAAREIPGGSPVPRDVFWQWFDSWQTSCPPYHGFHWKCGQESAVRLIALTFGFWTHVGRESAGDRMRDWQKFARLAWVTGFRIQHHISYAISQKNNHAISEAAGLILISHLFPEFSDAEAWSTLGRRVLTNELRRQIYNDGSYVQHSMNYQRVMLHGAVLAARLLELQDRPLPTDVYQQLGKSVEFLVQMLDPDSGEVPQYGNNDGALVLPLSESPFWDFRPVIQTAHYLVHRDARLPAGPWDEERRWLFGEELAPARPDMERRANAATIGPTATNDGPHAGTSPGSTAFRSGGYYTLRSKHSWCLMRCHTYVDRPAHYDQLHVDLWWRGQNMLRDCGTFRYYLPDEPAMETYFKSIRAHNTIEINDGDPLQSISRFLWLPWPRGTVAAFRATGDTPSCEATHFDYEPAPWRTRHRRTLVDLGSDAWLIVDDLTRTDPNAPPVQACLRWQLAAGSWHSGDEPGQLRTDTPQGSFQLQVAVDLPSRPGEVDMPSRPGEVDALSPRSQAATATSTLASGWASISYGERTPIPVHETRFCVDAFRRVITFVAPGEKMHVQRLHDDTSDRHAGRTGSASEQVWRLNTDQGEWTVALAAPTAAQVAPRRVEREP